MEDSNWDFLLLPERHQELYKKLFKRQRKINHDVEIQISEHIFETPYPTLQLLYNSSTPELFEKAISLTVQLFIDSAANDDSAAEDRFLNFICNFHIDRYNVSAIKSYLLNELITKNPKCLEKIYLALFARPDLALLNDLLFDYATLKKLSKHYILFEAIRNREHVITSALRLSSYNEISDNFIRNNFVLLKIVNELDTGTQSIYDVGNLNKLLELFVDDATVSPLQRMFYRDFCRIRYLIDIMKKQTISTIPIECLTRSDCVLHTLSEYKNIFHIGYDDVKKIIEDNHSYKIEIQENAHLKNDELQIVTHFFVLATAFDLILTRSDELEQIGYIKMMMLQIRNLETLCDLINDIFKLIFLRWEQLQTSTTRFSDGMTSTDTASENKIVSDQTISKRNGFICKGKTLKEILVFLKNFTLKKLHSDELKQSSDKLQNKFSEIVDAINDGIWKYSVLENIIVSKPGPLTFTCEEVLKIIHVYSDGREKVSSDDESRDRSNFARLARRKAKTRKRLSLSNSGMEKNIERKGLTKENHSFISRMLGTPESLAAIALGMENFTDVKNIIQNFKLQNTQLEKELNFVENQQSIRRKLILIYDKYLEEDDKSKTALSTVEEIRNIAAKGFEVSKIVSIVENVAQNSVINHSEETKNLFEKFANTYNYLHQYDNDNLKVIVIMDLITSLPFNTDIYQSISNLIEIRLRNQRLSHIGCLSFFENIKCCLRILKQNNALNIGVRDMLTDNFYTLKSAKLTIELEKERAFVNVFYKHNCEIGYIDDLKLNSKSFDELKSKICYHQRFFSYVSNLAKLIQLRDRNLEFHVSELLKFDPRKIIGELIFEENMTPLEIESNVLSLNLNLVHVIALNICPQITPKRFPTHAVAKEKNQSIFNYITNQNLLLGYLLQNIHNKSIDRQFNFINEEYLKRLEMFSETERLTAIYKNSVISVLLYDDVDKQMIFELTDKFQIYEILTAFAENFTERNTILEKRNEIILNLITENSNYIYLIENISDLTLRASTICKIYTNMQDYDLITNLILSVLNDKRCKNIPIELIKKLQSILEDTKLYSKISDLLKHDSWRETYTCSINTPSLVLENLFNMKEFDVALKWVIISKLYEAHSTTRQLFYSIILKSLLELRNDVSQSLKEIIELFPEPEVVQIYENNKDKFRSVVFLYHVINYLERNNRNSNYTNYRISLNIFEYLCDEDCEQNWSIFSKPLLIIEQLIMNSKFKILTKILAAVEPMLDKTEKACKYCFDKLGNIYDIHTKSSNYHILGSGSSSAFILLNFNLYHKDHVITRECIDLQLRIYATKALDYQISDIYSSSERISLTTEASLDSLLLSFVMPKTPPTRDQWIRDDEALHCMCCKCAVFTMLIRRHHCRRCGRVVCFACSRYRMKIPNLYEDVPVRICNDCFTQTDKLENKSAVTRESSADKTVDRNVDGYEYKWQLSGNITHDKLLREEFCYEHAPSVPLCLSILAYHHDNVKCVRLLLYHCRQLENLLVPNPEVDYVLVTKMMNCLALAAKVRGGPSECDTIRDYSDIVKSVVLNGCENLLPAEPLNKESLRKLGDALVQVEKWTLALEVFLKCGFPTAGVMAAHGLACLRAGCFETAREKFSHCMPKLSTEVDNSLILKIVTSEMDIDMNKEINIPITKRPNRSPPLLEEITKLIELTSLYVPQPETIARATIIRSSNTSLASTRSKRKDNIPLHEPALNILTTLANLKQITKGHYGSNGSQSSLDNKRHLLRQSRAFEECLYYILTYGSHADMINFFMHHNEYSSALKYFILESIDSEIYIQNIFMKFLKTGKVKTLIDEMLEIDDRLLIWKDVIISTCWFLESKSLLNSLYQLQILLKDPVRASMTCVKFYSMNCLSFKELQANSFHLHNAQTHLQAELELCQWENINIDRRRPPVQSSFLMQMDARTLNAHINTILRQLEVTKFLAKCEQENILNGERVTDRVLKQIRLEAKGLPTLFDSVQEKIQICILIMLSGANIEEGFGLAYRIIQDYKLPSMKVYGATSKFLSRNNRLHDIDKLIDCISSNNGIDSREIDDILTIGVNSAVNITDSSTKSVLDNLIKKIQCVEMRISCHIFIGQLKSAYLLAVQYNRLNDIRKILRHAEATNQIHIKKLCEKKLNMGK